MSSLCISSYPKLQGGLETVEDYSVATTFEDIDIIVFNKVPKEQFSLIEEWIEEIIEHEQIHITLYTLGEKKGGHTLDFFFPHLSALWDFKNNPLNFKREFFKKKV